MIVLWILGILALIVACILAVSVTVYVKIGSEVDIKVGAAGLKFSLYPTEKKPGVPETEGQKAKKAKKQAKKDAKKAKKDAKKAADKEKKPLPEKKANEKSLSDTIEFVLDLLRSIVPGAAGLVRKIRFTQMRIFLSVGASDAEKTALQYGQVCTAVYNLLACIDKAMTLKVKDVSIVPDFVTGAFGYDISFKAKLRIGGAVASAFGILFKLLGTFIRQANSKNKAAPPHTAPKSGGKPKNERIESV